MRPLGQGEVGALWACALTVAQIQIQVKTGVLNVVCAQNTCTLRTAPGGGSAGKASERGLEDDPGLSRQRAGHAERCLGSTVSLKLFFFLNLTLLVLYTALPRMPGGARRACCLRVTAPQTSCCRPGMRRILFKVTLAELPADPCAVRKEAARNREKTHALGVLVHSAPGSCEFP